LNFFEILAREKNSYHFFGFGNVRRREEEKGRGGGERRGGEQGEAEGKGDLPMKLIGIFFPPAKIFYPKILSFYFLLTSPLSQINRTILS
jgi:hypothetical protein